MAETKRVERPLSPFMIGPYYRVQMTSMSSIMTRATGNALIAGFLLGAWWLIAAVSSPGHFAFVNWIVTSWIGWLIFAGMAWSMWYHYLTGLRHLWWDSGRGLDIETAEKLGWGAFYGATGLTLFTLIVLWIV
ncbi:succinate dehydrogenase, cytochrome b556 subunit [Rhodobacter maris]|uniref:Succinate dehydrogenase cytochrome b556 subunit n=1 Tax=Rhodobacter maris TaxID=446682 RepID=A0A285RKQ6_9RHOB|nr:succinate dehydrogenase, cytochrome b556 subunit [Rhodobacter maris]SOB94269.1 succinate dehydrogenase subunit C [Rhodobacter maris]